MQKNKTRILSTATLPQSVIDMGVGHDIVIEAISFTAVKPAITKDVNQKIIELSQKKATIIFTSANALEIVINILQSKKPAWKVYCTAGNTKKIAGNYFGEDFVAGTGNDALSIADKVLHDKIKEVFFFCGKQKREELPSALTQHGVKVNEIVVYDTISKSQPVTNSYSGILFFSPSAVQSYFSANSPDKSTILFAIGNTTAESIKKFSQNKIIISESPEKEILIKMAVGYFQSHPVH